MIQSWTRKAGHTQNEWMTNDGKNAWMTNVRQNERMTNDRQNEWMTNDQQKALDNKWQTKHTADKMHGWQTTDKMHGWQMVTLMLPLLTEVYCWGENTAVWTNAIPSIIKNHKLFKNIRHRRTFSDLKMKRSKQLLWGLMTGACGRRARLMASWANGDYRQASIHCTGSTYTWALLVKTVPRGHTLCMQSWASWVRTFL